MRIAINGFGRIGRSLLRIIMCSPHMREQLKVVVINVGPSCVEQTGYLFEFDTIMGRYSGFVEQKGNQLLVDGVSIPLVAELVPVNINWKQYDVDWVVDCSGQFTLRQDAQKHLDAGAKHVLISASAHDEDVATIVPGVNNTSFDKRKHKIVSLGSCTTNALMPMLKVMNNVFGIEQALATTTHAYTNTQVLLDKSSSKKDVRRNRAAALNIIPTTTGAAGMISQIIPELDGKIHARAIRVPVGNVSLLELVCTTTQSPTTKEINKVFITTAQSSMKSILACSNQPLVSSDYIGNSHSVTIDMLSTYASGAMSQIFGWYDNEWGYSCRLADFLLSVREVIGY